MKGMFPDNVEIVEVGPRDGLQNEAKALTTEQKLRLIERLSATGLKRIEVASFVHPALVPQMADAEKLVDRLSKYDGIEYEALVLNWRGFERAQHTDIPRVNFAFSATETFNMRNQNAGRQESLVEWGQIARSAARSHLATTVTMSVAFGCPFEGAVSVRQLTTLIDQVLMTPPDEIALADTIGVASPRDVLERIAAVRERVGDIPLRCHFHNSRNTGLANAYAAIESGVTVLDASVGGLGGCPFAPNATGNIPTEDLVYMLDRMNIHTGVNLISLISEVSSIENDLGKMLPGMLSKAGIFPGVIA